MGRRNDQEWDEQSVAPPSDQQRKRQLVYNTLNYVSMFQVLTYSVVLNRGFSGVNRFYLAPSNSWCLLKINHNFRQRCSNIALFESLILAVSFQLRGSLSVPGKFTIGSVQVLRLTIKLRITAIKLSNLKQFVLQLVQNCSCPSYSSTIKIILTISRKISFRLRL